MKTIFYLSRILNCDIYDPDRVFIGRLKDLVINPEDERPRVTVARITAGGEERFVDFDALEVKKEGTKISCIAYEITSVTLPDHYLLLGKNILDKQIIDLNGRKLVRVNDIRLVSLSAGSFVVAVDVGWEGLLRRLGVSNTVNRFLRIFKKRLPTKFILWDDVSTIDPGHSSIKLSRTSAKLKMIHPSDLADIIEDLNKSAQTAIFSMLEEERAADVLEEMEPEAQVHIIESLSKEKAADVLELMPADEVADIMDGLEVQKAEEILQEMDKENSEEVRDLLEYKEDEVGSIMTTEFISFDANRTVADVMAELRREQPEDDTLYSLLVLDADGRLLGTVSLMELVTAEPDAKLSAVMNKDTMTVFDEDPTDTLAEIVSKYNMLAVPVINRAEKVEGIVVIDDIVEDLLQKRKTS